MPANLRQSAHQKALRGGQKDPARSALYRAQAGPQLAFMTTDAQEVLYGGAAGGGKSYALRMWGVTYCMTYPGAQIVLFRETYRQLDDTHIRAVQLEVPSHVATFSSGNRNLNFPNGSVFQFRFCEREEDVYGYDTTEYDAILFDELTHFAKYTYTYLISRCRSTKEWWPGRKILSAATPLGKGHSWVKERFVDPSPPNTIWLAPDDEGGLRRLFIPAKVADNPALAEADPDYVKVLKAMPKAEYQAKALGDWNVASGQFFKTWSDRHHIIDPFEIDPEWDRFICVDYGFAAPYAVIWFARPPESDSAYIYREHYGAGVKPKEQVYRAYQATKDERIRAVILDPSMFSKSHLKGERFDSISTDWIQVFTQTSVVKGNNERVPGWKLVRAMMDWQEHGDVVIPPKLRIFSDCKNLIRTLPFLITDKHNPEDVDSDGEDHAADALRYGLRHAFEGAGGQGRTRPRVYMGPGGLVVKR